MSTTNDKNQDKSRRKPLDASHGKDRIEIEKEEAKAFNDMGKFAPMNGDLGDESTDVKDLPIQERKNKNTYDPAMGVGGKQNEKSSKQPEGMHKTVPGKSGMSTEKGDSYVDKEGKKKIASEKREHQDEVQNPGNKES
jgi:hypothetical protein